MRRNQQPSPMAFDKYRPTVPVDLPDRTWPNKRLERRSSLVQRRPS